MESPILIIPYFLCVWFLSITSYYLEYFFTPWHSGQSFKLINNRLFLNWCFIWLCLNIYRLNTHTLMPINLLLFDYSASLSTFCGYVSDKNWGTSSCVSQVNRYWETTHIYRDWEHPLCLSANRSSILASCNEQTEQYNRRFRYSETSLQTGILSVILQIWHFVFRNPFIFNWSVNSSCWENYWFCH